MAKHYSFIPVAKASNNEIHPDNIVNAVTKRIRNTGIVDTLTGEEIWETETWILEEGEHGPEKLAEVEAKGGVIFTEPQQVQEWLVNHLG